MQILSQWYGAAKRCSLRTFTAVALILAITVGIIVFYPREYRSQAQLLLRIGRENVTLDPTADATGQHVAMQLTRENEIQTALEVMRSRVMLEAVVDRVGADVVLNGMQPQDETAEPDAEPGVLAKVKQAVGSLDPVSARENAIRQLSKGIDISARSNASVVTIDYVADTPADAQLIVESWVEAYMTQHADFHRTSGSYEFFRDEEQQLRQQIDAIQNGLREAKSSEGLVTVDGHQRMLENQLGSVRGSLVDTESALSASQARAQSLAEQLAQTDNRTVTDEVSGKANEARDLMRSRLFELEVLERDYSAKYKADHPRMIQIREQLAEARKIVDDQIVDRAETTSGINPVYQQLQQESVLEQAMIQSLREKRNSLRQKNEELNREVAQLNTAETKIADLQRQLAILESRYAVHSERLDQARLDEALGDKRINNVNVIQPATLEERPVTPDKKLTAIVGVLAALATAFGLPLWLTAGAAAPVPFRAPVKPIAESKPEPKKSDEALLHPMFLGGESDLTTESTGEEPAHSKAR